MKYLQLCIFLFVGLLFSFSYQIKAQIPPAVIPEEFRNYEFDFDGIRIPYRLFKPENIEEGQKLPVIVGLHGAENFGAPRDRFLELAGSYALGWLAPDIQRKYPCYVLAPHIYPSLQREEDYQNWSAPKSREFVKQLVDHVLATEDVDPDRVYLTGHSMGGIGTLMLPKYLNDYFAALVPMNTAGGCPEFCDDIDEATYDNVSIWGVHHRRDAANQNIRDFFSLLESFGNEINLTHSFGDEIIDLSPERIDELIGEHQRYFHTEYRYPCDLGFYYCHITSMDTIISDTLFQKWLFKQHRRDPEAVAITSIEAESNYTINWEAKNPEDHVEVWFRSNQNTEWLKLAKTKASAKSFSLVPSVSRFDVSLNSRVRLVALNDKNLVYGSAESEITRLMTGIPDEFKNFEFDYDGLQIPYRLFKPENIKENQKLPVIVGLHGGENFAANRDQFLQKAGAYALGWLNSSIQEKYPCYVVAPHLYNPLFLEEGYSDWEKEKASDFLKQLIDHLLTSENIDPDRIYLTGHSIGGVGTFLVPGKLKNYFAALVPMNTAGGASEIFEEIDNKLYDSVSIWGVHHRNDVSDENVREAFERLEARGQEIYPTHSFGDEIIDLPAENIEELIEEHQRYFYTEYRFPCNDGTRMCHTSSMDFIIPDPLFQKWLFRQHRIDPGALSITALESEGSYAVNWEAKNPADSVEIWFRSNEETRWVKLDKIVASKRSFNLLPLLTQNDFSTQSKLRLVVLNSENFVYGFAEAPISAPITGIPDHQNHRLITYPNPAGTKIYCKIPEDLVTSSLTYSIVSSQGVVVKNGQLSTKAIDVTNLNPGIYLMIVQSDNRYFKDKLTIAR